MRLLLADGLKPNNLLIEKQIINSRIYEVIQIDKKNNQNTQQS